MNNAFYGREKEITWLVDAFKEVATRDKDGKFTGPQILAVLSESGLGKSRLVQELYCRIADNEIYNPDAFGYWPKEFGDSDDGLYVSPDMTEQTPKGPPKFIWLGARWKPTDERNPLKRDSVFPEINNELNVHNAIMQKNKTAWLDYWSTVRSSVLRDFSGEARGQLTGDLIKYVVDVTVPLAGLISNAVKKVLDRAADRSNAIDSYSQVKSVHENIEFQEMLNTFTNLLSDEHALPVVLWLDDAQWADQLMQDFLPFLKDRAEKNNWPLLIVITHWEREYLKELGNSEKPALAISALIKEIPEADRKFLAKIEVDFFKPFLEQNLPGLTPPQIELLCEKADGNFLTMVENVGNLKQKERIYFIDKTLNSALNNKGVESIGKWESKREQRVEQRFYDIEPVELQNVLALGANQGVRFMAEIIVKYLQDNAAQQEQFSSDVDQCINPYAILSRLESSNEIREFRDKLYVDVARKFFDDFYVDSELDKWNEVFSTWLTEQISNCFDESGNLKANTTNEKLYFINGSREEKRTLITLGKNKLDLGVYAPLAVQFVHLSCLSFEDDRAWTEIRKLAEKIENWNWEDSNIGKDISIEMLINMQTIFKTSGAYSITLKITVVIHRYYKQLAEELGTPQSRRDVSVSLNNIANIIQAQGQLPQALLKYQQSLEISKQLAEELGTPESRRDVSISLNNIAGIEKSQGQLPQALLKYQQGLEISKQLAEELGTPQSRRGVSISLEHIADIDVALGQQPQALLKYQQCLEIFQQLAWELGTPGSRRDVSVCLDNIAGIERALGQLPQALNKYQLSLEISKQLAEELGTPESRRDVSVSLNNIANIIQAQGQLPQALLKYQQSLEIFQQLAEELGTPESRRDVSISLNNIAGIEKSQGQLPQALLKYQQGLEISKQLAEELGTPQSRRDVSISLEHIADIEQKLGNLQNALNLIREARQWAEGLDTALINYLQGKQEELLALNR